MKRRVLFDQVHGILGSDGHVGGGARQHQRDLHRDRHGRAQVHVLSESSKPGRRNRQVIGIEGHVRDAEVSIRVRLHVIRVVADRIFDVHLRSGHGRFRRVRDRALDDARIRLRQRESSRHQQKNREYPG